ncbi:sensor histidine kinase [Flagellimonas onchidii]|uniref:sensor histidine kinase n=1 Tax=Flagellimonas onchidii TaxID=2562684 RepID=UPI001455ECA4|nr:HAMP domain-containing sensor histidine kinase [Allomuricauda onchidii]
MKTSPSVPFELKQLPLPIAIIDNNLEIKECSDFFYTFFGLLKSGKQPISLKDLMGEISKPLSKIGKKPIKEFFTRITNKGEVKWYKLILYPSNTKTLFYAHFDEVTKKKMALDFSLQAERIARIGSWEVDLINHKIFWSEMTRQIHEVPKNYVPDLEKGINFYKEGENRDRIIKVVSEAIEKGTSYDVELIIVTAKGNEKWVRAIGNAEMVNGKASKIFGVFQDIDKTKRESIKYKELTDRMRMAVESSNIGIWDYDIVNNNLVWDDNMYSLYQVKKEDFTGVVQAWESTVHPDDKERSLKAVEDAIVGKKEFNTEFRIKTSDGSIRYIHGRGKVFRDDNDNPIRMIGANTDVSRIKKVDNRLRILLNTTEKQNKSLLNFAHIVSHNLRSHSSNLSMLTGMLLDNTSPDKQQRFLEMIRISSERLDETIVQLNEVIKIQTDDHKNFQWVKVKSILENNLEGINALVEEVMPKIQLEMPDTLKVYAIKPYLSSIFLNLLTNSIKYRDPKRKLRLKITASHEQDETIITFKDNGRGIDLKRHGEKLFGMYKTFHGNKDAKGVGLFISKNQMDSMGAVINVESKVDKGTTFSLHFNNKVSNEG